MTNPPPSPRPLLPPSPEGVDPPGRAGPPARHWPSGRWVAAGLAALAALAVAGGVVSAAATSGPRPAPGPSPSAVAAPATPARPAATPEPMVAAQAAVQQLVGLLEALETPPPEPTGPADEVDPCAPVRAEAPPGTEAWVDIDALGMHLPIVDGGQSVIDSGVVAHYRAPDWLPPVEAGEDGAYWLAAHSTCGLFATVPELADGAEVVIRALDGSESFRYRVVDRATFDGSRQVAWSTFYRWGSDRPYAVIQTCLPGNRRVLIYAVAA